MAFDGSNEVEGGSVLSKEVDTCSLDAGDSDDSCEDADDGVPILYNFGLFLFLFLFGD